jgi:ABC-type oligopeptide transport system substrate-binding subunit
MRWADLLRVALLGAVLLASGCGESTTDAPADEILDRGLGGEPESLDPHRSRSLQAGHVQRDLGEGLTGYSATGELEARAAESWDVSADGRTYTFHLRADARWSNGEPVTAEDFVYSFRRLVDPETAAFYSQSIIDVGNAEAILAGQMPPEALAVSAPEPHTLVIRLERPTPYFLALLTHPSMFPVHRASIESAGGAASLITNGAYRLLRWDVGSLIELERNEHYWDAADTAIGRVRWHIAAEPLAELNRYRAGELEVTDTVPPEAFAALRAERPAELKVSPYLAVYYYGLNLTRPPFKDNPHLRQALSMAIDREVIAEKVVGRGETPAYNWVPPGVDDYESPRPDWADLPRAERHALAQAAYARAGYGPGNPAKVEIRYNTSDTHERIALAVQSMWRDVLGAETTLVNEEFQVLLSNMRAKEVTQVFRSSWSGDYNDAHTFLNVMTSDAASNMTGYASDEFDALMRRAAAEADPERRREYMQQAEAVLLADYPVIPLYFFVSKHLVSPKVEGWGDNVLDYHYSQHLSFAP